MEKIINSYECLFIVDVTDGEEAAKATVEKFTDLIAKNAEVVIETAQWGKRRLAYPINDKPEGYYVVVTFKSVATFPSELERLMNIDEKIMRTVLLRLDHEPVAKSAVAVENVASAAADQAPAAEVETAPVEEAPVADVTEA